MQHVDRARPAPRTRRRPARERVVRAADRLFYEEGIQAVGVDRIALEADVSKASLYAHFRTKQDLVAHYLAERSRSWQEHVAAELPSRAESPGDRIVAVFALLGEWFALDGYRGCPFINAAAECGGQPGVDAATRGHRDWVRTLFLRLGREAHVVDPEVLAAQLTMLYDGAMVGAQLEPDRDWARDAGVAAAGLVAVVG